LPCCYFKRWFMENKKFQVCDRNWVGGTFGMCDIFLTIILSVCRYPVLGAGGGVWGRHGATWEVPETLLCSLWIHLQ
jgi:hypothetical protein